MDGCPRQNSKLAKRAIASVGGTIFSIPPRSPDLNPIENFFHTVSRELQAQAIRRNITSETFEEFSTQVIECLKGYEAKEIDKIINSMEGRIDMVLKRKGQRIKY